MTTSIGWESAILEAIERRGGIITLSRLYQDAPRRITGVSSSADLNHTIRAYLRRLKQKQLVKQIGLATYALHEYEKETFYEKVSARALEVADLKRIPEKKLHGYVEGMLVELGNLSGYDTYTADRNVVFNGQPLRSVTKYAELPQFTYPHILEIARRIDVIWFRNGGPSKTFDIENSTDFTKALVRAYQLAYFKTQFFMVADERKKAVYTNRIAIKPFDQIKPSLHFVPYAHLFDLYKNAVRANKATRDSIVFAGGAE